MNRGKLLLLVIFMMINLCVYASSYVDIKDDKGYIHRTVTFKPTDKEFSSLTSIIFTYDQTGKLISRILYFNDKLAKERDLVSQEEIFSESGKVDKYIITFTDDYYKISGIKKQIEIMDDKDTIIYVEYFDDKDIIFGENFINRQKRFPFYKISFLYNFFLSDYKDDPDRINYQTSMRYVSATSVVTFIEEPIDINQEDKEFIIHYLKSRKNENLIQYYSKKVLIKGDDKYYYVLMQDALLPHIFIGKKVALSYYYGTREDQFMMLCVGFTDID